nr:hypothetical protein [Tanacetum cinerariifolium]
VIGGRLCGGCVVVEGGGDGWVAEKGEAGGGLCSGCVVVEGGGDEKEEYVW